MNYLIYLTMPTYLAQWYANECTQVHNRDKAVCPHEVYRFPDPIKPVELSQESRIIHDNLLKQPSDRPEPIPADATLAVVIPSFPNMPVDYYNYLTPSARELLVSTIYQRFQREFFSYMLNARVRNPRSRIDLLINTFMENNCIEFNDTNWNTLAKNYKRMRDAYRKTPTYKKNRKKSL